MPLGNAGTFSGRGHNPRCSCRLDGGVGVSIKDDNKSSTKNVWSI